MADFISGLIFVVASAVLYHAAGQLPSGRGTVPGAGFFPELLAMIGIGLGVVLCLRALWALRTRANATDKKLSRVPIGDVLRSVALVGLSAAYIAGLRFFGFPLASATFLLAGLLVLGERRILVLLLLSGGLTAAVLIIFTYLLGLRLPPGRIF